MPGTRPWSRRCRRPVDGWQGKCLYVWFEAVIGYLSAPIEWAQLAGQKDAWRDWWTNPDAKQFHFIGKDNIFFHTSQWPAELMGVGEGFAQVFEEDNYRLNLPFDVPANQFMNLEGDKMSTSRGWSVEMHEYLEDFPNRQDELRYCLLTNLPETKDSEFTWKDFQSRNNSELVAILGNFVNRVLVLTTKYYEGVVPVAGIFESRDLSGISIRLSRCKTVLSR